MKPIWKILISAAVFAALLAVLLAIPHYRAKAAVRAYREQLKRQGEKLSIAELTPSFSEKDVSNGRELAAAAGFLSYFPDAPSSMRWLAPGQALLSWRETNSATEITTNCWPGFSEVIKEHQDVIGRMEAALRGPGLGFSLDYQQGFNASLSHLLPVKRSSIWLWGATILALHEGDRTNAWNHLKSETDLVRMNHSEPLMISQLVRAAIMQIALAATWETLQYPGWSDAQLAQLQTNWDSFNLLDQMEPALSMERAMQGMGINQVRNSFDEFTATVNIYKMDGSGYDSIGEVLVNPKEGVPAYLGRHPRYWIWKWRGSYDEEVYAMQIEQAALASARTARTNDAFSPALEEFRQTMTNLQTRHPGWERRFVFANSLGESTSNFLLKIADAETERRMVVTAIALERYRLRKGEYPAGLPALTPDYQSKVPIDFMDGKPLRYRRKDGETFLLYSVGEDGKDDGGDGSVPPNYLTSNKQWYKMRDAVWPAPATPDEVKKYEAEMFQKLKNKPRGRLVPQMVPEPAGTNSKTN